MYDYNQIKKNIINSNKLVYWFNSNYDLLLVKNNKSQSNKLIKQIKYNGNLIRLSISFHTGTKKGQGGPIAVHITQYEKNNLNIIKILELPNGIIWFNKNFLERLGWNEKYLYVILKKLKNKNLNFDFKIITFESLIN
jgi:hypothetical protein